MTWRPSPLPGPKRARRPTDSTLLRRPGAEVDALIATRGEPPTRWRGTVERNVHGLVALRVAGTASTIEFLESDVIEIVEWWSPNPRARLAIETIQAARLGRSR